MGAWIEIGHGDADPSAETVAPFVGVWIEMLTSITFNLAIMSLPLWERGLKYADKHDTASGRSRSLRGSVE